MALHHKSRLHRVAAPFMEIFGLSWELALLSIILCGAIVIAAVFWFFHSAPPHVIIMTAGAPGSSFATSAEKYRLTLESNHVTLKILSSKGSLENLERLDNPSFNVDVGFVQGGLSNDPATNKLLSLGSIKYQPLLVFYTSDQPIGLISGFSGKRIAVGSDGSGTRALALQLLALNGIKTNESTNLLALDGDDAAKALLSGSADVVFLMGDTTSSAMMRQLLQTGNIRLFDFTQADAYTRRISYLNKLTLPQGAMDFGKNIPDHDVSLIGPTVEIITRPNLNSALSDMLIEAAKDAHGAPSLFSRRAEFPAPIEHDFPISQAALSYYQSGKRFLYKYLPFWVASLIYRILIAFVPLVVVMIPALKVIPAAFRWRMKMRINRWYRELLALERNMATEPTAATDKKLMTQLDRIENEVNKLKVPSSFAGQFYDLRGNIQFVRNQLTKDEASA